MRSSGVSLPDVMAACRTPLQRLELADHGTSRPTLFQLGAAIGPFPNPGRVPRRSASLAQYLQPPS